MDYVDWIVRFGFLGMMIWAIKGYVTERTKKRRAGDQTVIWSELYKWCKECKTTLTEDWEKEMGHVVELIKKDLETGQERFGRLEAIQSKLVEIMGEIKTSFELLKAEVERSNNGGQ